MVRVRLMRMAMHECGVPVTTRIRFARRLLRPMNMAVMLVMNVAVLAFERFVFVQVFVMFNKMEIKPDATRSIH
jgi:hypothetical protein